jgi:crossover junction endodeoxyribonuclease RuvC
MDPVRDEAPPRATSHLPPRVAYTCRILGVDTSLRSTGVGVVDVCGSRLLAVHFGTLRNPASRPLSACLLALEDGLTGLLQAHRPEVVAVEGVFFAKYVRATLMLGHARGVVLAACTRFGVPVFEYEPRRVKQAVVGQGGAAKEQVQRMVQAMLALPEPPQEDAADALAIAICHAQNRTRQVALGTEPI